MKSVFIFIYPPSSERTFNIKEGRDTYMGV